MSKNLLGVDFGTTALKACLFSEDGELLASESASYKLITKGEFIEFDANEFFNVFITTVKKITAKFRVDAMSIDTQGETLIVLDRKGEPLMNAIIWLDSRASKEAKEFEEYFSAEKIYNLTGQAETLAGYPAPKIMWLKNNAPDIFYKADKFLLLEDYILYRLTGKFVASRSLYSSSLLMNVKTGEYIPEVLSYLGITEDRLPVLKESGELIGEYNGIKVATSALDQIAGITGAGVVDTGVISETTGTALAVSALTLELPPYYEGLKVSAYYVKKGVYCLLMWSPTAGAVLEWLKKNFCEGLSFGDINALAESVDAGSEGLICIPYLCGTVMPTNSPSAKGVFYGLELKHTRAHFIRAVMEAISYNVKTFVDYLGVNATEIRAMGGGANSKLWCEIKASVLGKNVVTLKQNETACLGSAVFAGLAIGVYNSIKDATDALVIKNLSYSPKYNGYDKLYKEYKVKEDKLLETF